MNHTEELLERWEAIHEIENMMGRRAAMLLTIQDDAVFFCLQQDLGDLAFVFRGFTALREIEHIHPIST